MYMGIQDGKRVNNNNKKERIRCVYIQYRHRSPQKYGGIAVNRPYRAKTIGKANQHTKKKKKKDKKTMFKNKKI